MNTFTPFRFDPIHDAALLNAAGYVHTYCPESWEDVGGPESGPHVVGGPAAHIWSLDEPERGRTHEIIVVEGEVVEVGYAPLIPEGWES